MNEKQLIEHWRKDLRVILQLTKDGKPDDKKKHRAEGFLYAIRMAGLISSDEATRIIEEVHYQVFGESVEQRKERKDALRILKAEDPDAYFAIPTIERK